MFMQKWRDFWGLSEDPFTCEDADKDLILTEVDTAAVHWSFDRMYGNPRMPAPAIVFGEKGSGKSALRLMINRRLDEFNEKNPDEKVFKIEYIDFNTYIENFRRTIGVRGDYDQAAKEAISRWKISDHIDSILSLGVTKLVDEIINSKDKSKKMGHKEKLYLLIMTAIYYHSEKRTAKEAIQKLKRHYGMASFRPWCRWIWVIVGTVLSLGIGVFPFISHILNVPESLTSMNMVWHLVGITGLVAVWGIFLFIQSSIRAQASRADRCVKILQHDTINLANVLKGLSPKERREFILPRGSDAASRYQLLDQFISLLDNFGYKGVYVLLDRIDEPSMLSSRIDLMRPFIETLMDIKFLQYPKLGLKLFLPIELDEIYRNASPEQLKRMRLDKSNLIGELKWSGQELYEIANQRMQSCQKENGKQNQLAELFEEDFDFHILRDTLTMLGTPRYAFGFFSSLFTEYVKDLPNDLPENDPRWRVTRSYFEVTKAAWIDRSGVLRRVLN